MSKWQDEFRQEASDFHTEAKWTFWKFAPTILVGILLLTAVGFGLRSVGLIGSTVVERKVFENSYQRSEALRSEIAQAQATISILENELSGASSEAEIKLLKTKILAAKIRLATVEGER